MDRIRTVVIGAGRMGQRRIAALRRNEAFELVGVLDSNPERLVGIREATGVLPLGFDAAIVSTPGPTHREVIERVIVENPSAWILVEKPIATTVLDARACVRDRTYVGHTERFNPVIENLRQWLGELGSSLRSLEFIRQAPSIDERDPSGVLDLLVHDLDLLSFLLPHYALTKFVRTRQRISCWCSDGVDKFLVGFSALHGSPDSFVRVGMRHADSATTFRTRIYASRHEIDDEIEDFARALATPWATPRTICPSAHGACAVELCLGAPENDPSL